MPACCTSRRCSPTSRRAGPHRRKASSNRRREHAGDPRPTMTLPKGSTIRKDAGLYGYERALRRVGLAPIAGVDEAGRGACAGPLVAAAAILPEGGVGIVPGLADSKLLTAKARERCYEQILRRAVAWSVVVVPHDECDRVGMHVANVAALRRSLARLEEGPADGPTDGVPGRGPHLARLGVGEGGRGGGCLSAG